MHTLAPATTPKYTHALLLGTRLSMPLAHLCSVWWLSATIAPMSGLKVSSCDLNSQVSKGVTFDDRMKEKGENTTRAKLKRFGSRSEL
eukprot:CAMPEP_0206266652 /NCGR_PEP_ID=MMETSP0047_2-20121206/30708_1 /ASSEMBLY_ACC=CAM_ASM_000192 /TAXON_ID=195065 /ORGANISM="Chroomonas mesostigmatica_cf, Strain CCMP1168" /LENGTH=87 /DNA_ID=CAMNT_0053694759 /DNA_START=418 /DNA_END=681 /DNA_ORIENTATION=+